MAGQFVIKQIAQEVISEVNQPLYIGGIDPLGSDSKLTIASNGNVSTATPLTVPSLTVNSKPVMSSLLAEYTVTGSAVTSIDFSGLDINTHKSYRVEIEWYNNSGSSGYVALYINGDTTSTNYYMQYLIAEGTSVSGWRGSAAQCMSTMATNTTGNSIIKICKTNGYVKAISSTTFNILNSVVLANFIVNKSATVSNVTQITLTTSNANGFSVGTSVRLYRGDV